MKRVGLRGELLKSHLGVAALSVIILIIVLGAILSIRHLAIRLTEQRSLIAEAAFTGYAGMQRSIAALRGWIQLEDPEFRKERRAAWDDEILPAIERIDRYHLQHEDALSHDEMSQLKDTLYEILEWQWWIEDVAHTPGNQPALLTLTHNLEPVAESIEARTSQSILATRRTENADSVLPILQTFFVDFESSRAAIDRFASSASQDDKSTFLAKAAVARESLAQLNRLKTSDSVFRSDVAWLVREFDAYEDFSTTIIRKHESGDSNLALKWLQDKAVPRARQSTSVLSELVQRQQRLMQEEKEQIQTVSNTASVVTILLTLVLSAMAVLLARRASRRIAEPIALLCAATGRIAGGELKTDLPVDRKDEIGQLTSDFNAMRRTIQENEENFRVVIEGSPSGMLMVDDRGTVLLVNRQLEQLLGYPRDELVGRNVSMLVPITVRGSHDERLQGFFAAPSRRSMGEGRDLFGQKKDGTLVPIEIGLNPVQTDRGAFAIASVVDISDRKETETVLRVAKEVAENASRSKSEFLANMSHELRTPLNSVIGFSSILLKNKKGNQTESDLTFLGRIRDNGSHLLRLINEVLDLSKVEAGQMEVILEDVPLEELITETIEEMRGQALEKGIELTTDIPGNLGSIRADKVRIKQVLINLVGNAIKFTSKGGVQVNVVPSSTPERAAAIDIIDSGVGIPTEKVGLIFEAFQQADTTTSREFGGTGLGLAIAREFCRMMKFDITVTSERNIGSTFRIDLTAGDSTSAPKKPLSAQAAVSGVSIDSASKRKRVLVIDDNDDARELLVEQFGDLGCDVLTATDGRTGLDLARAEIPDLITVDLMMPGMSGWDVVSELRTDPDLATIPVVVISFVANESRATFLGSVRCLQKPVESNVLKRIVDEHLGPGTAHVLIVEDDPDMRAILRHQLEGMGLELNEAGNGKEALERLETNTPDLILVDLMMPVMDGLEFLRRLRAERRWAEIPVIVVSAKELTHADREFLGKEARAILPKGEQLEQDLSGIFKDLGMRIMPG